MQLAPAVPAQWEQQLEEGVRAFAAFAKYRDLGPQRSLAAVGRAIGKSTTLCEKWSARWSWAARARAYDEHLDRRVRLEAEQREVARIVEFRERQREFAVLAQGVALKMLDLTRRALLKCNADEVTPATLAAIGTAAARIGEYATNSEALSLSLAQLMEMLEAPRWRR